MRGKGGPVVLFLKETLNHQTGELEYLIVDLPYRDDFEVVERVLTEQIGCKCIEKTDGIWFVVGVFEKNELRFRLTYHQEVGHYVSTTEQTTDRHRALRELLNDLVEYLSAHAQELGLDLP
jgi:hypothetical protein